MIILGIETSCDETAASVVENGTKVLSHVLASSADMHTKTGGIIPEIAAREQLKSILPVIDKALVDSLQTTDYSRKKIHAVDRRQLAVDQIDAIAVTYGPGLIGSLIVGVETARTLAYVWDKPIVPVNHLLGHIYANFIRETSNENEPEFPALALVISGGHTDMILMKGHGKSEWIGGTRDDAAGEAFDKTARLLGLPYPGGPAIAAEAQKHLSLTTNHQSLSLFPRPMLDKDNFDWSFSGLKTAVLRETERLKNKKTEKLTKEEIARLAAEIQEAIVDSIVGKVEKPIKKFKPKSFLVGGGVAANPRLREKLSEQINRLTDQPINLSIAQPKFCTDNASMIAAAAYYNYHPVLWKDIRATPELTITAP